MSRFNVMPRAILHRSYRLRAWLADNLAPPGYIYLPPPNEPDNAADWMRK